MIPRPNGAKVQQLILMVSFTATYLSNEERRSNQEFNCQRRTLMWTDCPLATVNYMSCKYLSVLLKLNGMFDNDYNLYNSANISGIYHLIVDTVS